MSTPQNPEPQPSADSSIGTLSLVEYPHPALFRKSKPLLRIDEGVRDAVEQMFDIMYESHGVGLAANQVALPYRMFVVNATGDPDSGEELAFLNPILTRPRGTAIQEEGCLSLPGLRADVRRPQRVVVEAWSVDGQPIRIDLDGFLARVVQHEFDHLEGRLFTDRLPDAAGGDVHLGNDCRGVSWRRLRGYALGDHCPPILRTDSSIQILPSDVSSPSNP